MCVCLFWGNLYRIEQQGAYGKIKGLAESETEEGVDVGFVGSRGKTASRGFLPPDKNNLDPTSWSPRRSVGDPVTAEDLSQRPAGAAWPGVAVVIRIATLMLN